MPAKFKADSTFTIQGRGLVVAGEILEGVIKKGMQVSIPSWPNRMTISEVSSIRRLDRNPAYFGLAFASEDEKDFTCWKALDLRGQVLEIED